MPRVDLHSRLVGWLKIILPLTALAILSTLFLLADRIDPEAAIPYAKVDVEDLARDPRMAAPTYAGLTSDGAGITLTAAEAHPAKEARDPVASSVAARLDTPDGQTVELTASQARLDSAANLLLLTDSVILTTGQGYRILTDALSARLDRTLVESRAPVQITAPLGDLSADSFTLTADPATPGAYLLVFKGGVKLVYQPGG
ncbi:MAG: LPS export ABC transporter periplasmic protein LptC [Paracoccaceae bacterium]